MSPFVSLPYTQTQTFPVVHLEDHLVRPVTLPQAEVGAEVSLEQRLLLDCGQKGLVDLLLVLCALSSDLLLGWCLALLEESLLGALLVGLLVASKVLLAADLGDGLGVDALDWDGSLGGDNVAGVDTAERDTVDLEWASHKEDTLVKDLQEDHTLAPEAASEENENSAGSEGCAGLVWVESLAGLFGDMLASCCSPLSPSAPDLCRFLLFAPPPPSDRNFVPCVVQTHPRPGNICWPSGRRV